jgi:hypothetical protein
MTPATFALRPVAGQIGAEVEGVDLSRPIDDALAAELRRALVDHLVLFFRDQALAPEHQLAFTRLFGPVLRVPYVKHLDEHPDIIAVLKEADERNISTFGNAWHSDFSFLEEPPLGSILYAREVPSHGGDTLFANMYQAYEALSAGMKRMLEGLRAMIRNQFDLPLGNAPVAVRSPDDGSLIGLRVKLNRAVDQQARCHDNLALIHPGKGPHSHELRCTVCGQSRGWLKKSTADFLTEMVRTFGVPVEPFTIRDATTNIKANHND